MNQLFQGSRSCLDVYYKRLAGGKVRGKKAMMLQKDGVCGLSFISASERKIIPVCFCWYKHLGICLWGSGG